MLETIPAKEEYPLALHIAGILTCSAIIGIVASGEGAVIAAVVAGILTFVNTGLTVWLTGRQKERDRKRRKRTREE